MTSASSATPLVFLPGFMLDETLWDEVVQHLDQDMPIYRLLLGPGKTMEEIAESVASVAPEKFVLVGFSLGGYVARKVAELYPDRVAALILIATSLRADTKQKTQSKRDALAALSPASFRGLSDTAIAQSLHPDRRSDSALIARIRAMGMNMGYEAFATQSLLRRDGIAATSLRCPTLVIAARQDALRTAEESQELVAAIPGATLEIVEDSGHLIPMEQPTVLAVRIKQWVASI